MLWKCTTIDLQNTNSGLSAEARNFDKLGSNTESGRLSYLIIIVPPDVFLVSQLTQCDPIYFFPRAKNNFPVGTKGQENPSATIFEN
jgi:hypothetical protein